MSRPVFRFAPSPNGYLHLGHALSALINFEMARSAGGCFLLRMEDIDAARCRPEFEAAIYEDLAWLGIVWEGEVRRQSEHLDEYGAALARLNSQGLLYTSFESRTEIARLVARHQAQASWPRDPEGAPLYPGPGPQLRAHVSRARTSADGAFALRLDMARAAERASPLYWSETGAGPAGETGRITAAPQAWGDVVLARKDVPTSYHISVVVDDALQGVTDVVRGQDLFFATSIHRLLQTLLELPQPRYHHHRLVLDAEGQKLSKSTRSTALRRLRSNGLRPHDIRRLIGVA